MNDEPSRGYSGVAAPLGHPAARAVRQGGRDALRAALLTERARTLALADAYASALGPALRVPRNPVLNPPLWELGHIAWFQQWWIARNRQRERGVHCDPGHERRPSDLPQADAMYDSSTVPHERRWDLPLPDLQSTLGWLQSTQKQTLALLGELPGDAGDEALYFFRLACLHEAMHAEAACYMAGVLGFDPGAACALRKRSETGAGGGVVHLPAQAWSLGSRGAGFAFDNELLAHEVTLDAVEIDAQPVSWSRFHAFAEAGGYDSPRWWTPEGWAWRQQARPLGPSFPRGDEPARHLSLHEAQAWCRWAGRRLPSEAEWECAAVTLPGFAWGTVWEWTASAFQPYPGFQPHPYRDYSAPWFGDRQVLRGACEATSPCMVHPRYRNFFEAGRIDVFAGFRSCA
jgi:gamma-glutamyl hercynylcysteine S-oxide synthase